MYFPNTLETPSSHYLAPLAPWEDYLLFWPHFTHDKAGRDLESVYTRYERLRPESSVVYWIGLTDTPRSLVAAKLWTGPVSRLPALHRLSPPKSHLCLVPTWPPKGADLQHKFGYTQT